MNLPLSLPLNLPQLEGVLSAAALGFLGSGHCLAMCGPLACATGSTAGGAARPVSPLGYHLGRIATYGVLGAAAGALGGGLAEADSLGVVRRVVAALAGLALVLAASRVLGLGGAGAGSGSALWARLGRLARAHLPARSLGGAVLFGLVWGLLPCGLVYSAVLVAAAAPSGAGGAVSMVAFGLGTAPMLLATTFASRRLGPLLARPVVRVGAALVLLALAALQLSRAAAPPTPERPCCHHE